MSFPETSSVNEMNRVETKPKKSAMLTTFALFIESSHAVQAKKELTEPSLDVHILE
jgi:hypothetical protein